MSKQKCKVECNEKGEVIRVIVVEDIKEQTQEVPKKNKKGK
jgi:hypothetical protein